MRDLPSTPPTIDLDSRCWLLPTEPPLWDEAYPTYGCYGSILYFKTENGLGSSAEHEDKISRVPQRVETPLQHLEA